MNVKEFIEVLQLYPPDLLVVIDIGQDTYDTKIQPGLIAVLPLTDNTLYERANRAIPGFQYVLNINEE